MFNYLSLLYNIFAQAIESKVEAEQRALQAENDLKRIEVEARQFEAQSIGIAQANIAEASGEAEAINIINARENVDQIICLGDCFGGNPL